MPREVQVRRSAVIGVVAIALVAIGFLIGRTLAPIENDPGDAEPSPGSWDGRTQSRTEEGALRAATEFARVVSGEIEDPGSYRDAVLAFVAPEWETDARRLVANTLRFVESRYGADAEISFSPIRYRVSEFSDMHAVIDLWGVTVASGSEIRGLEESWITATIRLGWLSNRWFVVDQQSRRGPTPESLGSSDDLEVSELRGFQEYERAAEQ